MTQFETTTPEEFKVSEPWTIQRVLKVSTDWLQEKNCSQNPRLDVEILLASSLKIERIKLFTEFDRPLSASERELFKGLLRRRSSGEPIAYLVGYRDFFRHRFEVNSSVLIPRPDTEVLVEQAIIAAKSVDNPHILEIGSGSGCIAISIAAEVSNASVDSWDISEPAIAVARRNAEKFCISNVSFSVKDGLLADNYNIEPVDMIVSNPPYIAAAERTLCSHETLKFEPAQALFPSDPSGLMFYEKFSSKAWKALKPEGLLMVEIGFNQGEKVAQLFRDAGWRKISIIKDLGGMDRVLCALRPSF